MKPLARVPAIVAGLLWLVSATVWCQVSPELPSGWTPKSLTRTTTDMVVAANPDAVDAGIEILRKGGNAVDAAVAVQMALNVVEPESSGIGGGAFLLAWDAKTRTLEAWDGRETAPAAATERLFLGADGKPLGFAEAVTGGRSVGVPGAVAMLAAVHRERGRLAWAELFGPAIRLAEKGFRVTRKLNVQLAGDTALRKEQPAAKLFYDADGTPRAAGSMLANPELGETLRALAAGGEAAFYSGAIARDIVDKVRSHPTNPGLLTLEDLAAYRPKKRQPICGTYREAWRVCGMPMPSSGGATVLQILGILERFDLARLKPGSVEAVHLIAESHRLAYADRGRYMADSDFVAVPVAGLIDREYLRQRAAAISLERSMGTAQPGTPPGAKQAMGEDASREVPATSHVSIVDAEGNAVSMTTTIESMFGSRQMVRGFLLNNQLTDFSFAPVDAAGAPIANRVEPGKRPRSSMSPTVVFDSKGRLELVVGSPGGSQIIQYVAKVLIATLDWRLDVQAAIDLGNFGAQTSPTTILEKGSSVAGLGPALQAKGHAVSIVDINSGLHAIRFDGAREPREIAPRVESLGGWAGGADPRREGVARGR